MFNDKDLNLFEELGISTEDIENQINIFREGIDFVKLVKPATLGDGIENLDEKETKSSINYYEELKDRYEIIKFIPASGAASRMFKALYEALEKSLKEGNASLESNKTLIEFFDNLKEYPFYHDLDKVISDNGDSIDWLLEQDNYGSILEYLLQDKGLNYGKLPKGLLKFHTYSSESRTAFEEHYEEAGMYIANSLGNVNLHFTVSPEHVSLFSSLADELNDKYMNEQGLIFNVGFSVQKPSTDTIAVTPENEPFRDREGNILFRPGGHGALLDNLNDLEPPLVFIGNIDNVSPDRNKDLRVSYKKSLGGFLLRKVEKIHEVLDRIKKEEKGDSLRDHVKNVIYEISPLMGDRLSAESDDTFYHKAYNFLNRPVRVCGMVRNVGEPGGGPFWVSDRDGMISRQIIESSQINLEDENQEEMFRASTHFNPVDLVCFIHDHEGNKFDLKNFRDPDMAFISEKSQGGKNLKALELPGLWNGSMAGWLTWFVDVPLETFSPVKTVYDLLRPEHQ